MAAERRRRLRAERSPSPSGLLTRVAFAPLPQTMASILRGDSHESPASVRGRYALGVAHRARFAIGSTRRCRRP